MNPIPAFILRRNDDQLYERVMDRPMMKELMEIRHTPGVVAVTNPTRSRAHELLANRPLREALRLMELPRTSRTNSRVLEVRRREVSGELGS